MSTFIVPLTQIKEILPHPNADRLELAKVYDWTVVVQKGAYLPEQEVIYVPVDSILPWDLEQHLFPPESKIKLNKSRIKAIRIRGVVSQGMLVNPYEVPNFNINAYDIEQDVKDALGITKYEPAVAETPGQMRAKPKRAKNRNFKEYIDIYNLKWYDRMFQDGEEVYISEKLHGTSFRCGWVKNEPNTLWKKFLNLFGFLPEWEFCWGSRRVQIQNKIFHKGFYETDVYTKIVKQYDLMNKIPKGYVIYGEIVGDGIQKNYTYGCGPGEHKLYVYDIQKDGKFLSYIEPYHCSPRSGHDFAEPMVPDFKTEIELMGLEAVPCLYVGPYSKEAAEFYRDGDSTIAGQKIREGVVIKPTIEKECSIGRKVLKFISDSYKLKNDQDGTDFH
jgi:RNA ligase (TIGR02306 family)